jgi:hypothetical protein
MKAASMPALILLPYLAMATSTLAAVHQAFSASPDEAMNPLQASLATSGLEQPQVLYSILRELGLPSVQDVRLLGPSVPLERPGWTT